MLWHSGPFEAYKATGSCPPAGCTAPTPTHLRLLLFVNLQGQLSCWQAANTNGLIGDQPDGSSEASRESSGNKVCTLEAFIIFSGITVAAERCIFAFLSCLQHFWTHKSAASVTKKMFSPPCISLTQANISLQTVQTVVKWTNFNFVFFCQDISATLVCST